MSLSKGHIVDETVLKTDFEDHDKLKCIINNIFSILQAMNIGDKIIIIDGQFDSNLTKFEYLSNGYETGVICNDKKVGYILLFFLRIIIDIRYDMLYDVESYMSYYTDFIEDGMNYENIINNLSEHKIYSTKIYKNVEVFNGKLENMWDIDNIYNTISKKLEMNTKSKLLAEKHEKFPY